MADSLLKSAIQRLKALKPLLHEQYGVSDLWVFGSVARGEEREGSDLDVLVAFDRRGMTLLKFVELEMLLSEKLGVEVDLVQRSALRPRLSQFILAEAIAV